MKERERWEREAVIDDLVIEKIKNMDQKIENLEKICKKMKKNIKILKIDRKRERDAKEKRI